MKRERSSEVNTHLVFQHQVERHGGAAPNFISKVTKSFSDCLTRQISEEVLLISPCFKSIENTLKIEPIRMKQN